MRGVKLLDISRFLYVVKTVVRRELAFSGGAASCLRRVFVSNVMSSCKAKFGPNFLKYGETIPITGFSTGVSRLSKGSGQGAG